MTYHVMCMCVFYFRNLNNISKPLNFTLTKRWILKIGSVCKARSQNDEKRLLTSPWLSLSYPSIFMGQLGSHSTNCRQIWLSVFRKTAERIQISFKPDPNNGYFTWIPMCIYHIFEWELCHAWILEIIKTHFMFNNFKNKKSCRLWDNVEITCDRSPRRRFFLVSLCLKANAGMVPKIPGCYYFLLM